MPEGTEAATVGMWADVMAKKDTQGALVAVKITVLVGGIGGARFLLGVQRLRDVPMVTNLRHIELLGKAAEAVERGRAARAASHEASAFSTFASPGIFSEARGIVGRVRVIPQVHKIMGVK